MKVHEAALTALRQHRTRFSESLSDWHGKATWTCSCGGWTGNSQLDADHHLAATIDSLVD
jgi:hypothetical protein